MEKLLIGLIFFASCCLIHAEGLPSTIKKTCTAEVHDCHKNHNKKINEDNTNSIAKQKAAKLLNEHYNNFLDTCTKKKALRSKLALTILEESNIKCAIHTVNLAVEKKKI